MKLLPFRKSKANSIGIELEIQLVNPITFDLISRAKDLIRNISLSHYAERIKPEITQSMLEINSSIHDTPQTLHEEFLDIRRFLLEQGKQIGVCFSGGGTHPFQKWTLRKIFPNKRFKNLSRQYRYLSKCSTIFGLHIHIGCTNTDDAIYLTHALARYVPHIIAIGASSPFYQGVDTGYHSSRLNSFSSFPSSGVIPYLINWKDFSYYYYKMRGFGIINSMKDFYWDIRPKPEFGTVEIRVADTPLTISKTIMLTAYVQALACYLLKKRPIKIHRDLYFLYSYNRFQACRYGYDGSFIDPYSAKHLSIGDDILATLALINETNCDPYHAKYLAQLKENVLAKGDDATQLRQILKNVGSLPKLVNEQCKIWSKDEG